MPPVHGVQQVGLLGLGGQPGGRPPSLHIDDHQGQLEVDGQPDGLRLEVEPGPAGGGHPEGSPERRAQRGTDTGDLVFGLEGTDAELLAPAELVEDVRRRCDRVTAQEERQPREAGRRDQAPGQAGVARHLDVLSGLEGRRAHLVVGLEELGRLAEVEAGPEGPRVGLGHLGSGAEPVGDPLQRRLDRAGVEPADQAQGEEVLRALGVTRLDARLLAHLLGDGGHRDLVDGVRAERAVRQGVLGIARLGQVPILEGVAVDQDDRPLVHQVDVGLQGGRVHGHQDIGRIARGQDVVVGDVDLEGGDAVQRPRRGPDLRREVRERRQVVAHQRARCREAIPRQLHAVARVPGEPDDDLVKLGCFLVRSRCHGAPSSRLCALHGREARASLSGRILRSGVHLTPVTAAVGASAPTGSQPDRPRRHPEG